MTTSRRTMILQSMGLALAARAGAQTQPQTQTPAGVSNAADEMKLWFEAGDLVSKMEWLNPPASVAFGAGGVVTAKSRPRTDFWRKTFYGYITDNGHFFHVPVFGEFMFQARINGKYAALYDQAGLMVRLDEKHWMKCGSELVEGKRWASVVFTHEFSDWSTTEDLSQSEAVYWRVVRRKDSIEAQCSKDGVKFLTLRQGYFPPFVEVKVGVMCAAPEGSGFEAVFDELKLLKP